MWNRFFGKELSIFYVDAVAALRAIYKRFCLRTGRMIQKAYRNLCLRAAAAAVFALVWWGVLYPELCFTETTCEPVVVEQGQEIEAQPTDYTGILEADGDEVVVKSRLLEWIEEKRNEKEMKNKGK